MSILLNLIVEKCTPFYFWYVFIYLLSMYLFDQYDLERVMIFQKSFVMLICCLFFSGLLVSSLLYFAPKRVFGREVLVTHFIIDFISSPGVAGDGPECPQKMHESESVWP